MSDKKNTEETESNNEQELDLVDKARIERDRQNRFPGADEATRNYLENMYTLSVERYLSGLKNTSYEPRTKDESHEQFMMRISKKHYGVKD